MTVTFISNVAATNPNLPQAERDDLLIGVGTGLDLYDLSHPYSYRSTANAANGQPFYNLARNRPDASIQLLAGATGVRAGGGLDITPSASYAGLLIPNSIQSALFADQEYILCAYVKIPTTASWPSANIRFIADTSSPNDSIVQAYFSNVTGQFVARRTTTVGGGETRTLTIPTEHHGKVAQFGVYRTANSWGFIVNCDGYSFDSNQAAGAKATADWSGRQTIMGGAHSNPYTLRFYRGFVENLSLTERTPAEVLSEDWLRVQELGLFS